MYELRVHSTTGSNAALNRPSIFVSGSEDSSNPASNAVDGNINTFAATDSGDGTLEVTLENDINRGDTTKSQS